MYSPHHGLRPIPRLEYFEVNDIIGCLLNLNNGTLNFYRRRGEVRIRVGQGFTGLTGPFVRAVDFVKANISENATVTIIQNPEPPEPPIEIQGSPD